MSTEAATVGSASHAAGGWFEMFMQGWLARQQQYLYELSAARERVREAERKYLEDLINRVLIHHAEYFDAKARATEQDAFKLFNFKWYTPVECAFTWITGFKPTVVFRLVWRMVHDLTAEQRARLVKLYEKSKKEERELNGRLAHTQEYIADLPLRQIIRQRGIEEQQLHLEHEESNPLRTGMASLVKQADSLRRNAVLEVVEVLTPAQAICFLAAAMDFQRRLSASWLLQWIFNGM